MAATDPDTTTRRGPRTPLRWLDERLGTAGPARAFFRKVFPDHWSFLLGEIAMFSLILIVLSGVFLTFFYTPSIRPMIYDGPYDPLRGQEVSAAFNSVMRLSFEVRAGLLMRQFHHWAALVFIAAIVIHLARVFFTGAYRRPRELNYLLGFALLILALAEGITGYSLPDDLLSGVGIRIIYSGSLAIPVIGPWLTFLIFGGEYPTEDMISRFYVFHIMLLPALLIGGFAVHLGITYLQKHTQFRGIGRTERNVIGKRMWPEQAFKMTSLFLLTTAVLAGMGGLLQINPIWEYGPYNPYTVTSPAQPDWYIGWLDGALRLGLPWDFELFGYTISELFIPGLLIPGLMMAVVALWPWIEPRFTKERGFEHHLLDRPRDAPYRTATGVAGMLAFFILFLEGGNDVVALLLDVPVEWITRILQVGFFVFPVIAWLVTFRICKNLQESEAHPADPNPGYRLRRTSAGAYETVQILEFDVPEQVSDEAATNGHTGNGHAGTTAEAEGEGERPAGGARESGSSGSGPSGGGDGDPPPRPR